MSPERFSEDELVERPAMQLLAELGWETVNAYRGDSRATAALLAETADARRFSATGCATH